MGLWHSLSGVWNCIRHRAPPDCILTILYGQPDIPSLKHQLTALLAREAGPFPSWLMSLMCIRSPIWTIHNIASRLAESGPYWALLLFQDVCLSVCMYVCMCVCLSVSTNGRPRQRTVLLLRSSSKVKAGQWVTPNPTRPTILDQIC